MTEHIDVLPYDPQWPFLFEKEAQLIKQALGDSCIAVHHIGSTSVPDLCAKPKIDILVVVKSLLEAAPNMKKAEYTTRGELNIPFRFYFTKRARNPEVNLHMYEEGNPEIDLHLLFRDFLRTNPEARKEYAQLKERLLTQESLHRKTKSGLPGYTLGKDTFIKRVLKEAGFNGLCMRVCTHYDEWEAARSFRQKYFFDKIPISDPYTWTFDHPEHVHFIFYQGTRIIGYVHIQLWKDQRAALRIMVLLEDLRNQGLGRYFLKLCERWLKEKGYAALHIESSPAAYPFYVKQRYQESPFNDPQGNESHPDDIAIAKDL